jgi:hypothetical protein
LKFVNTIHASFQDFFHFLALLVVFYDLAYLSQIYFP